MEKLKLHTPDLTAQNIERLAQLFPDCVTETQDGQGRLTRAIDFDQLRQELSGSVVDGPRERYHLDWPGKREAILAANAPIAKTLRPCREESVDFDTTKNLFIEGDNLDALKLLQETYLGKVKVIYIDPPYNTGSDLIYDDNFVGSSENFLARSNQIDDAGNRLVVNRETDGRFHSDWLTMLYPRLRLARNLLSEGGIILISIDDGEVETLRLICNEIFGEANFVAQLVWEKGRKNDAKLFSIGHDYIVVYARSKAFLKETGTQWREAKPGASEIQEEYVRLKGHWGGDVAGIEAGLQTFYQSLPKGHPSKKLTRYSHVDGRGVWRDDNMSWPGGGGPRYDVIHPVTQKACKVPDGGWRYSTIRKMNEMIASGNVEFREDHTEPPVRKTYLLRELDEDTAEDEETDDVGIQVASTYFYRSALQASNVMVELLGEKVFDNPKDHEVLARWIRYVTGADKNALVLDFFAGSGSTGHAVMSLNAEDRGSRRYILVQLPAPLDPNNKSEKAGAEFCQNLGRPMNIAEITKERLRRAGQKIKGDKAQNDPFPDLGFRVLRIDTSNMRDVYYAPDALPQADLLGHVDNIRPDRAPEDLLFQVLVDWGLDLALPIADEAIGGKTVFFVDGNALAACFDSGVTDELVKEIAKRKPLRAVFRDASYGNDSVKINVDQIFRLLSPETEVRSI
jgi:adenine-specific DNA-methyltransferase